LFGKLEKGGVANVDIKKDEITISVESLEKVNT
jgi:hypothetical protein